MILYFTGVPGSGKSYYGVDYIYKTVVKDPLKLRKANKRFNRKFIYLYLFAKSRGYLKLVYFARRSLKKSKTYYSCYTNINGLKFDQLDRVFEFNFRSLDKDIKELYGIYKENEDNPNLDDVLNDHAKSMRLYKSLFVIDECHNYFDTRRAHLIWWLTYHRHMYQDIILITQNLSLVEPKYKRLAEMWYRAKPKSLSLFSHVFKYDAFTNPQLFKNSKAGTLKVKKKKQVFDLYQSGDSVNVDNVLFKFIKIAFVLLLLLLIYLYLFVFAKDESHVDTVKNIESVSTSKDTRDSHVNSAPPVLRRTDRIFKSFLCNSQYCFVEGYDIPILHMPELLHDYGYEVLYSKPVLEDFKQVFCLISPDYVKMFKDHENHDNSLSKEFNPFNSFS